MTSRATKRCFASAAALRRFDPGTLGDFLARFPDYFAAKGLKLPARGKSRNGELDYERIRELCMAPDVPGDLNLLLFHVNQLASRAGWDRIREEAQERGLVLDVAAEDRSPGDLVLRAWMATQAEHEDLLEESIARARIHAKSSYTYYPPLRELRDRYRKPEGPVRDALRQALALHFTGSSDARGVKVLDYDYEKEIWFLVRYPGAPVRPDAVDAEGGEADIVFTPGVYDAIVYHKDYGDLRLNTNRRRDHLTYRIAFAEALLGSSNAFDPTRAVISAEAIKGPCREVFRHDDIPGLGGVRPVEICYQCLESPGIIHTMKASRDTDDLSYYYRPDGSLLPPGTDTVHHARIKYRFARSEVWRTMSIHRGKDLGYERDGDSVVLEEWLRRRGFIRCGPAAPPMPVSLPV